MMKGLRRKKKGRAKKLINTSASLLEHWLDKH